MHADRFFQTTRGKIVAELRRRGYRLGGRPRAASSASRRMPCASSWSCSSATASWWRRPVRRGPTKPTLEFSLDPRRRQALPAGLRQDCSRPCCARCGEQFGAPAVDRIFDDLSNRAVERAQRSVTAERPEERVAQLTEMLRERGVVAEYSLIDGGLRCTSIAARTRRRQGPSGDVPGDPSRHRRDDRRREADRVARQRRQRMPFEIKPVQRLRTDGEPWICRSFSDWSRSVPGFRTMENADGERRVFQRLVRRHVQLLLEDRTGRGDRGHFVLHDRLRLRNGDVQFGRAIWPQARRSRKPGASTGKR